MSETEDKVILKKLREITKDKNHWSETIDYVGEKLDKEYSVDPSDFLSKGKSTPFAGQTVYGECLLTVHQGKAVYSKNSKENKHG